MSPFAKPLTEEDKERLFGGPWYCPADGLTFTHREVVARYGWGTGFMWSEASVQGDRSAAKTGRPVPPTAALCPRRHATWCERAVLEPA